MESKSLFSEILTPNGYMCVCVGVVTEEVTVEGVKSVIENVITTTQSLVLCAKMMEDMEEIICINIREAEEQLMEVCVCLSLFVSFSLSLSFSIPLTLSVCMFVCVSVCS